MIFIDSFLVCLITHLQKKKIYSKISKAVFEILFGEYLLFPLSFQPKLFAFALNENTMVF